MIRDRVERAYEYRCVTLGPARAIYAALWYEPTWHRYVPDLQRLGRLIPPPVRAPVAWVGDVLDAYGLIIAMDRYCWTLVEK